VEHIFAIPMELRLAALFVFGACVGSLVNLATYRLACNRRSISPWSKLPRSASQARRPGPTSMLMVQQPAPQSGPPPRRLYDRIPIVGWLGLRRETGLHGKGFWIRPMLVELLLGLAFAGLYWWEIGRAGLLPPDYGPVPGGIQVYLHHQYIAHLLLVSLMLVASLIDLDEKTIPDAITVPGT
jgi:leader peptidase (prepilin peptidase) / N-methyltransferase